jgi:phosphomethylpyrimidine synthase
MAKYEPLTEVDFERAFPKSRKVLETGPRGVRVPTREIALTDGSCVRVYDTSGPQGVDVHVGLPAVRESWIETRGDTEVVARGTRRGVRRALAGRAATQLEYARQGTVTPEMEFVALREGCPPSSCARKSRAAARLSRPTSTTPSSADDHRPQLPREDQREHGNSAVSSSIVEEVDKLRWATLWAPTPSWLSTGKNIHETREWILRNAVPIGTVPIYQALEKVGGRGRI